MQQNNRAVAYCRVSTADQGASLEAQEAMIKRYCELNELELIKVYREHGVSGGIHLSQRPQGARMLHQVEAEDIDNVITIKLDRMFRSAIDALQQTERFTKAETALHILDMQVDTSTPIGKMMLSMMASFAEMERNLISERTKAGLQHRKRNKQAYTHTPYGYDRVGKNLLPNEQEQANIGVMQQLRDNGISYRGICSYLSEEGIFTKTGKPKWTPATVRNVLNNDLHSL